MTPKTKIFINGKLQPRVKGKYSNKSKLGAAWTYFYRMFLINTGILLIGSALVAFGITWATPTATVKAQDIVINKDTLPEKIALLKADVVNAISGCEVPGYKAGQAPIILDTNNKMSIGPMMFQVATVQHYELVLNGKTVNALEATNIALDEKQAKALAEKIMFEDSKGVANWWNCMNRTKVAPKIEVIKQLSK